MKKPISVLLAATMILSMAACGNSAPAEAPATESTAIETEAPATEAAAPETEAPAPETEAIAETEAVLSEATTDFSMMLDEAPGTILNDNSLTLPGSKTDEEPSGDSDYTGGVWTDQEYINGHLGLKITLNDDFDVIPDSQLKQLAKDLPEYMYLDTGFMSKDACVFITAEDLAAQGIFIPDYEESVLKDFVKELAENAKTATDPDYDLTVNDEISDDDINGQKYYGYLTEMTGKLPSNPDMLRYDIYAFSHDSYSFHIIINATDIDKLAEVLDFFSEM